MVSPIDAVCPFCGSKELVRLVSSFGISKTLGSVHEQSGEPRMFPSPDYYKDPRNIGRWTEKRFKEMGLEMPSQAQEMIDAAREGELPESVKDLQPNVKEV
jgi:hypothetical protein